jgi:hypothetical protein
MSNDTGIHADRSIVNRVLNRRTAVIGGVSVALTSLVLPGRAMADDAGGHDDLLELLLKGKYEPVVHGPNLGLKTVNLDDGSYSTTKIYPVVGIPGHKNLHKSIGNFYVQFAGDLCAYQVPGGSFAMRFTGSDVVNVDDGEGGTFVNGTWELKILEGTGRYRSLKGGHNHMVDTLHLLAPGDGSGGAVEYCFCFIRRP